MCNLENDLRAFVRPKRTRKGGRAITIASAAVLMFALSVMTAAAGPQQEDLKSRRSHTMERLGPESIAIFWSAPERVYSNDVNYEYRQDSNLLYLTGIDQEETILVLMPGNETRKEILFVREADARREHWNGHSLTPAEASAASGIETVMTVNQFGPFIAAVLSKRATAASPNEYARFFQALTEGRAKIALLLDPVTDLSAPPGQAAQFAAKL